MSKKDQSKNSPSEADNDSFVEEVEYDDLELLERLETLREDMEDLGLTTLAEVIQRITALHHELDQKS